MTSYFGAWLSNQNYYGQKKSVTAFSPRLAIPKENMELFFEVYPDGRLISLVRDPKNWFPAVRRHWPRRYEDVSQAVSQWNQSAEAALRNKERYADCVCIITFEDLVSKTEAVMRFLTEFLGIVFDDILLTPTFNKLAMQADTSFKVEDQVTVNSPFSRDDTLTEQEVDIIEKMATQAYPPVLRETVRFE
jgi:hypothetical protein